MRKKAKLAMETLQVEIQHMMSTNRSKLLGKFYVGENDWIVQAIVTFAKKSYYDTISDDHVCMELKREQSDCSKIASEKLQCIEPEHHEGIDHENYTSANVNASNFMIWHRYPLKGSIPFWGKTVSAINDPASSNTINYSYPGCKFSIEGMIKQTICLLENLRTTRSTIEILNETASRPLVSIVLPCSNAERFLPDCLESIFSQTYPDFELIAIDDGSSDATKAILKKQTDQRLIIVSNTSNRGITKSLNSGIELSKGKYIARMDADDIMHPDRLKKQVSFFESTSGEHVAAVGSDHYIIDQNGKLVGLKQYSCMSDEIEFISLFGNPVAHSSVMFRSEVIKNTKYRDNYPMNEDYALSVKLLKTEDFVNIPESLMYCRAHKSNFSLKNSKVRKESVANLLSDELESLSVELNTDELKQLLAIGFGMGNIYFNDREKLSSLELLIAHIVKTKQDTKINRTYSKKFSNAIRTYVKENLCGLYR